MDDARSHRHWGEVGVLVLEREARLPPDPRSARSARQLLRDTVAAAGREEWLDAGELAITEVVTNAVLHAHTAIDLTLAVYDGAVCVEVRDENPALPVVPSYDPQASTGRGLGLVAAVATACGVHSLGDEGKVIWFCIGSDQAPASVDDLLNAWGDDEPESGAATGDDVPVEANVELRNMPATLWLSARQHHDAILRELALYAAEHDVEVDLVATDHARSMIFTELLRELERARAAGTARPALPPGHPSPLPWVPEDLTVSLCVREEDAAAFLALQDTLDVAERLAVAGELLMRPALPEIVAVRDWACEQVIAQLAGIEPAPWAGSSQEHFETAVHARIADADQPEWDASVARNSDRGVVAADDANRIVAVSRPLAALLGWDPDDLVGRRVVTIIPPSLREAHVAGFSRHLTTGESHVLDVPLELPVLRADGTEITCSFLVQRAPANPGRSVYLAWIEPVEPVSAD